MLTQETSPETMYIGLRRFDKWIDQIVSDLGLFLEKNPDIVKDKRITIAFHLRKQLDQLGKNLREAVAAGIAWDKKVGNQKEFRQLAKSIQKKAKKINSMLSSAVEPDYN